MKCTSKQDSVVFLLQGNPHGLPEPVHNTLQRLIHGILHKDHKHRENTASRGESKHEQGGQLSMSQHKETAHEC